MSAGSTETGVMSATSGEATTSATTSSGSTSDDSTGVMTTEAPDPGPPSLCQIPFGQWKIGPRQKALAGLDKGQYDPVLLSDGVTLFFSSEGDSYSVLRTGFGEPFMGVPALNTSLNTGHDESKVMLSQDRLRAYLASNRPPALDGSVDFFVASRESELDPFKTPATWIGELATDVYEVDVQISADELRVYFARDVDKQYDLFFAARPGLDAPFMAPTPIAELNLPDGPEASPSLSVDERTIFFTSKRGADADLNIYVAVRADPSGVFGPATQVEGLAGPGIQAEPSLAERPEGCELFFVDNTEDGTWRIYRAPIVAI